MEPSTQKSSKRHKTAANGEKAEGMQISNISTIKYTSSDFKTPKSSLNEPSE